MARPKNQEVRRGELVRSARSVIARYGLDGARLHRIADEVGLSPGAVLYYYPDIDKLLLEAIKLGFDRFDAARQTLISEYDTSAARLEALVRHGLPVDSDDLDVRVFCQLGGAAGENHLAATMLTSLYDRQVAMYQVVLEQGAASGEFQLRSGSLMIARNIVALEDAFGYRIVAEHSTIDADAATRLILDYASLATGYPFE